jgi:site-specific DNA recombinase
MAVMELHHLKAIIYTRKSTVSDGKSTRDQERECRHWCDVNNVPVDRVFCDEGKSASRYATKHRDAWEELKAYLRRGHVLVAWESSRTARDLGEHIELRALCSQHGIPLAYTGKVLDFTTGDDRFNGALDALLAERESDQMSERIRRGMRGAAASGTPHARPPWGYRPMPRTPGSRPQWERDPVEAPRVREAVERVLSGEPKKSVLRWLQETGYAPATAGAFTRALLNPQLAGKRIHKGNTVQGTWEPIITAEQHARLVEQSKSATVTPGPEPTHLCSGIAKCGKCGKGVRYKSPYKGATQSHKAMYACPQGCASRLAETVDREAERAVLYRLRGINPNDYNSNNPKVQHARKRIEEIEADLAKWKAKAIAEEVDAETYAAVLKDRKQKIAALQPRTVVTRVLRPEKWGKATMRQKRDAVRALLNITLPPMRPGEVTITYK